MRDCNVVRLRFIFLTAALALLLPTLATAQAVTTQLTATEIFDPLGLFGTGSVGAITSPGSWTCPGTEPTGNPIQPCPPGSRINVRGIAWTTRVISQSPLLTGWLYGEGNANWDANGTGRMWGILRIELDAGGVWEGNWTADRSKAENLWVLRASFVSRGSGGRVEGMHLYFKEATTQFGLVTPCWVGAIDAEILAPPSR